MSDAVWLVLNPQIWIIRGIRAFVPYFGWQSCSKQSLSWLNETMCVATSFPGSEQKVTALFPFTNEEN